MDVNPNEVVKQVRLKDWSNIIQERNQSGLTIDEFCKKNGYTRNQYYYYLRKLRRKVIEDSGFVELPQVQSQATAVSEPDIIKKSDHLSGKFNTQMIIRTGNSEICINESTPKSLIAEVLEVLKDAE